MEKKKRSDRMTNSVFRISIFIFKEGQVNKNTNIKNVVIVQV